MKGRGLRARLIQLVLLSLIPAIALVVVTGMSQRTRVAEEIKSEAISLARGAAEDQEQLVEQSRQLLVALAQVPAIRSEDSSECSQILADVRRQYPFTANLGVIRLDGSLACSALPFDPAINLSDRRYFQRALENRSFSIGEYQIGRVTGVPSINFGYPVRNPDGSVRSIVFAALDLIWLNRIVDDRALPPNSTVTLVDQGGRILVRWPDPDEWVGSTLPDEELVSAILESGGQGTIETSGLDGVDRLYGFTVLGDYPGQRAYVAVGIPATTAFANADRMLTINLIGLLVIAGMALATASFGGTHYLQRPLSRLSTAASQLGEGDLTSRTHLPHDSTELGTLALSFDRMAESLERQSLERERYEQALRTSEDRYRRLFTEMQSAFVLHEMIYDEQGGAVDYRFLQVNPAFEEFIGFPASAIEGQTARAISPEFDELWLERYERVVSTGKSIRYEEFSPLLSKHLEVLAYRPAPGQFAAMYTDISARKNAEASVERQIKRLRALRAIDLAIASSLDPRVTFEVLLDQVTHQLEVDAADLLLYDRHSRMLTFEAGRGFRTDALRHSRLKIGQGQAGKAALDRVVVSVPNLMDSMDGFSRSPLLEQESFVSYYAAPLEAKGSVKGVLEVFHRAPLEPDQDWFDFLEALAGQAAIAIDNASMFAELRVSNQDLMQAYDTTLEGWAMALELRDDETEGHSARVTEVTVRLAREMGISDQELVNVRRGALLHDIGKMGIPDSILLKPGPLDDAEWEIMRRHPLYAYELLAPIQFLQHAIDIPYAHHERWDGSGYPRGLSGEKIPLVARIFAVVDVWDALLSDRPYRAAWDEERVREYLEEQAGKQFDPRVVASFLGMELETRRTLVT